MFECRNNDFDKDSLRAWKLKEDADQLEFF